MFEVKPIAAALGAELHGVDLCTELQPEVYAEIRNTDKTSSYFLSRSRYFASTT